MLAAGSQAYLVASGEIFLWRPDGYVAVQPFRRFDAC
jgi:hypothetical protein